MQVTPPGTPGVNKDLEETADSVAKASDKAQEYSSWLINESAEWILRSTGVLLGALVLEKRVEGTVAFLIRKVPSLSLYRSPLVLTACAVCSIIMDRGIQSRFNQDGLLCEGRTKKLVDTDIEEGNKSEKEIVSDYADCRDLMRPSVLYRITDASTDVGICAVSGILTARILDKTSFSSNSKQLLASAVVFAAPTLIRPLFSRVSHYAKKFF